MLSCYFRALRLGGVLTSPQAVPSGLHMTPPSLPGTETPGKPGSLDFILIVVVALDQETSGRVLDTLSAPPDDSKYTDLKQRLLTTFGLNKREWTSKLLHLHPLSDRKPSELMDEMLSLLADHGFCFLAIALAISRAVT